MFTSSSNILVVLVVTCACIYIYNIKLYAFTPRVNKDITESNPLLRSYRFYPFAEDSAQRMKPVRTKKWFIFCYSVIYIFINIYTTK